MIRRLPSRRHRDRRDGERGQILVLFTIALVVIMGFTALVIDVGLLRNNRQTLVNAMDAGALAGGTLLPVDGTQPDAVADMEALINKSVQSTYPGLSTADYQITYRCLIGTGAGDPGAFDATDIDTFVPLDCDPSHALGHAPPVLGDYIGAGKTRSSDCRPDLGDKCNIVVVAGDVTTGYSFGRVVGVDSGNTGTVTSSACRGLCGELPNQDFDVMIVLDDSSSMGSNRSAGQTRTFWAKKAANELMDSLEAARGTQRVGAVKYSGDYRSPTAAVVLSPLTTDFTAVRTAIAPLAGNGGNTPLKQGMALGASTLQAGARPGVTQVLVFVSDGRANPDTITTARPTPAEVAAFRSVADQVYAVAIGAGGTGASNPDLPLMRSLSKPTDDDHSFHVVDASDLPDVFRQIAVNILNPHAHLIQVYPAPIVSGVGGGATVTISGKYFTGASKVTFGAISVPFTVNSDTSISANPPNGPSGQSVTVHVTTAGGASAPSSPGADRYTYP